MTGKSFWGRLGVTAFALAVLFGWQSMTQTAAAQSPAVQYSPVITILAGQGTACTTQATNACGDGGSATQANLDSPWGVTYDAYGNLFIVDSANNVIRRVDGVTGIVTTVAGMYSGGTICTANTDAVGDGCPATSALLKTPNQVSFDAAGNMYIADSSDHRVRKVKALNGMITATCGCLIQTIAGTGTAAGSALTGTPSVATSKLNNPRSVLVDPAGDIFIANSGENQLLEIQANQTTYTIYEATAGLSGPYNMSMDTAGNLYLTDHTHHNIYKLAPIGSPTAGITGPSASGPAIVVGKSTACTNATASTGACGDGGPASSATLDAPSGTTVDAAGNLYIADTTDARVREVFAINGTITSSSTITTIAGTGTAGNTNVIGPAVSGAVNQPYAVAVSPNGSGLAISNFGANTVAGVNLNNVFPATAMTGTAITQNIYATATATDNVTGPQLAAGMPADFSVGTLTGCGSMSAGGICSAPVTFNPAAPGTRNSRLVLSDSQNNYILGVTGTGQAPAAAFMPGTISTFAGTGTGGWGGDGSAATKALLNQPGSIALDVTGNLYIADTANNRIRVVNPANGDNISTYAGSGTQCSNPTLATGACGDGASATAAQFYAPASVSLDAAGNLYIADAEDNRIREVSSVTGNIATVAGNGTACNTTSTPTCGDGGVAAAAELNTPQGVVSDSFGNLYIADTGNNKIRSVSLGTGLISTVAGTGTACANPTASCGAGGAATAATLSGPKGLALGASGNLYIADTGDNVVRVVCNNCASGTAAYALITATNLGVTPVNGAIYTIAGTGTAGYSGDGSLATQAELSGPTGVWVDAAGDVYIADAGNGRIRMVSAGTSGATAGTITTLAGPGTPGQLGDGGLSTAADLQSPSSVVADAAGNYYIADTVNNRIAFVNAAPPPMDFGSVNSGGTSGPQATTLVNIGNQTLTLSNIVFSPPAYSQVTGNPSDCAASTTAQPPVTTTVAPGASCQIRITFTPTKGGSAPGTVIITDNALNAAAATQTINLSGTGNFAGIPASITAQNGSGQVTPLGTFPALQALVTDNTGIPVGNASVTFTVQASGGASATFANGTGTVTVTTGGNGIAASTGLTANATRGTFTVTATVAGVSTPATFTETIAGNITPTIVVTPGSGTIQYGQSTSVTATLTSGSATDTSATGTVAFSDNGTSIGTGTVASGVATISYTPLFAGAHSLTASYSGDSTFSASTTTAPTGLSVTQFPITASTASVTLPYGSALPAFGGTLVGVLSQDVANVAVTFTPQISSQTPDVGQYPLTAQLSGSAAGNYLLSVTGNPTLTITQASTTTAVSASNSQPQLGASVTLTATVASTVNGAPAPAGSVTFYNGTTSLGTATLSAGSAGISTSSLLPGAQSITAVYAGNTDNSGSTSTAITVTVNASGAQALGAQYVPVMTVFAGKTGTASYSGDGNAATAATLNSPWGVTYDAYGNLFIADSKNNVIRRVDAVTGFITTVAGTGGTSGYTGDGSAATSATLNGPEQVAFDHSGNMYIADEGNNAIREVMAVNGMITTTCGCLIQTAVGPQGTLATTTLSFPRSVVVDAAGDIFVANSGKNAVLEYPAGATSPVTPVTYAATGTAQKFTGPYNMSMDGAGNLYMTDHTNMVILKVAPVGSSTAGITSAGTISIVAGTSSTTGGYSGDGGPATSAALNTPFGTTVDALGNLYIADNGNNAVREVNAVTQNITTIAGTGTKGSAGNGGAALQAQLNLPAGVAISPNGDKLVIASSGANTVQAVYMNNGFPATGVAGASTAQNINVEALASGAAMKYQLAAGLPADFTVGTPTGCPGGMSAGSFCSAPVTFNPTAPGTRNSRIVLTDLENNSYILGLTGTGQAPAMAFMAGTISTFAGTGGTAGSTGDGSAATAALLSQPGGIALDANGNLYIADTANNKIRVVNPAAGSKISTYAGTGTAGSQGDGAAATAAQLNAPSGISLDAAGNLYIADSANNRIRKVSAQTGNISTVAGTGTVGASGDGAAATAATLSSPQGVVSDGFGNLYIADAGNNKIRKVNVYTGLISTVAGTGTAALNDPKGVALDSAGNLYIADTGNNVVREVSNGVITTIAGTGTAGNVGDGGLATQAELSNPIGVWVDAAGDVYIADAGNSSIRMISVATGTITTVAGTSGTPGLAGDGGQSTAANLQSPSAVVADAAGDYYIADTANDRVAFVNATQPVLAFGNVNNGTTSDALATTLVNIGNQNLVLSGLTFSSTAYQQVTGNTSDCTNSTTLAPGAGCQIRATFTPGGNGSAPGTVTITDNALNATAATQTINLTANGITVGAPTAIAVAAGSQQTTTPLGPFQKALQALVTDGNNYPVGNVAVTFTVQPSGAGATFANGQNTVTATTANNGIATATALTANGTRGTFTVTASVNGVSTPATFTETIAGKISPTLAVTIGSGTIQYGQSATVTATLTPASAEGNNVTGTVTFQDNGTNVGSSAVASGTATLTYIPSAGTRSLTASYSGDSNFSTSTTAAPVSLTVTPLAITGTIAAVSVPYGTSPLSFNGTLTGVLANDTANVQVAFTPVLPPQTTTPDVGQYSMNGQLQGTAAGNYTLTVTGNPMLTITQALTTTVVTASPAQPSVGSPVTLTATVASSVSGAPAPAGSVTFYNGTTSLGTATLSAGKGNISTSTLPAGAQSITATYAGNPDDAGSTSPALAVNVVSPDYTISANPSTVTIQQGNRAYVTFTVAGNQAFSGSVSFSCAGLPAYATCTFSPTTLSFTASSGSTGQSQTSLLEIATSGPANSGMSQIKRPMDSARTALALIFMPGLLFVGLIRRRRLGGAWKTLQLVVLLAVGLCAAGAVTGCNANNTALNTVTTPAGASTISITAQAGSLSHTATFTLNVTRAQ